METDPQQIIVRPAVASEATQLTAVAFAAKRHWGYPEEWIQGWADELTVTPNYIDDHNVLVADADGLAVALVAVRRDETEPIAHIDHLWVSPPYMGKGIGARLLEQAVAGANAAGASTLRIVSDPNAEGFYSAAGAQRVGTVPSTPPGRSLPVLELRLGSPDHRFRTP